NVRLAPLVLQAQAELTMRYGDWHRAEDYFQRSIEAAANTEWYPGSLALYGHFLAVTGRRTEARPQLDKAAAYPEPPGFGGDFYIPFLAEGYLHLEANEQARTFIDRIQNQRGFMYYGSSVDRILGVVAMQAGDWAMMERAFDDGLRLCRRAGNEPEVGAILYEQARAIVMQSATLSQQEQQQAQQRVHRLCEQAREVFVQYDMRRATGMVDTLQEGIRQLETHRGDMSRTLKEERQQNDTFPETLSAEEEEEEFATDGYVLNPRFTKRELEVLRLVAKGHTDREVADVLVISPRTVNRHLSNIFVKLDVPGRAAAVAYAVRRKLVS
ncbi:MAG: helix-turn-helix transcriptional regulator, partial [Ktedonobacteraceae bacterium]|nr:helix-turn-helix transcriptional regulator [Ktedonobacteraceae bacterium]